MAESLLFVSKYVNVSETQSIVDYNHNITGHLHRQLLY